MEQYTYRLFLTKLDKTQICELDIKDFTYTENLSEQDEIVFSVDSLLNGIAREADARTDLIQNLYWILLERYSGDTLLSSKYFSIVEPNRSFDGGISDSQIKCISIDYQEFNRRRIRGLSIPSATLAQVLGYITTTVLYGTWTVGALPAKATTEYHVAEAEEETITSIFKRIEKEYNVLIIPDTATNTINVYDRGTYGNPVDLVLSHSNFVDSSGFVKKNDQLVTRLYVYGEDGVGISSVNPIGTDYIDDFSYFESYMSTSLLAEYTAYKLKVASYAGSFASLLSNLTTYQNELLVIEDDIVNLTTQKYIYDDAMSVYQSQNKKTTSAYSAVHANWVANNLLIAGKESDKTAKEGQITATLASISAIHDELDYTNTANFSTPNLVELSRYIFEDTINLDTITEPSVLLSYGQAYIAVKNEPVYEIDIDSVDLFSIAEAQHIRNFINVGDKAWLDLSEIGLDNVSIQMVSYTHNPFDNKLSFKFTNTNKAESAEYYMNDVFSAANKAAVEVKNKGPIWGEYTFDKPSILTDTSEIDAKKNIIRAGLGNTIDHRGFTGTDIGSDPNSHLKLLDDKIVLTRDEWATFHTVFSSEGIYFTNPENTSRIVITPEYGIQIDQNVAATPLSSENWDNRFYADAEGNLFIEGNIFVGDSAENIVIDRFGLNPSYAVWFKNLLPNTDAMVAQTPPIASPTTPFIPWMWTGCMSSADATFRTNRSFKVAPSDTMTNVPAFGGAAVNPSWLPDDMPYLRLSFWSKFGQASVKIKDQTNGNYFSLGKEDIQTIVIGTYTVVFDRQENWYFEPDSLWFDLTESGHSGCEDIRVEITNTHGSESLYISAPALSVDRTGSWPQAYIAGPYSIATSEGSTIEGSGLDPSGGGGAISGNLFVDTDFPANAPSKSVLVDTDDWSRYDKKDISSATTLTVEDNEHVRCAGSSNYSVTLHTGATTATVIKYLVNVGTALVTVVGTISGQTNIYLYPGESCLLATNGTNWDQIG